MNDAAQPSSRMVSKIKSSFLSQSQPANSTPAAAQTAGSTASTDNDHTQQITDAEKLTVFQSVLDVVEQQPQNQAQQSVSQQPTDSLNPTHAVTTGSKEKAELSASPDQGPIDAGAIQYVEHEKNPEIPVEVEGYLQKVEEIAEEKPQEVFIADGTMETAAASYPSRPVVVLPITEEIDEAGQKKNPTFSIRWLVEWSHKIIKMFAGKVVYREEPV